MQEVGGGSIKEFIDTALAARGEQVGFEPDSRCLGNWPFQL